MRSVGLHGDVPEDEYHSDRGSLSASGAKLLLPPSCPAIYRYRLDHPERKDVFDYGSAAHARVLGVGAEVEVVKKKNKQGEYVDAGDYMTVSSQAHRDEIRAAGKIPLLAWENRAIDAMARALAADEEAAPFLTGDGRPEVSAYFEDAPTGVLRRCRFDWLPTVGNGRLVIADYKTAASADEEKWKKAAADYGFEMQAAWYLDAAIALGLDDDPAFAFIVQEKTPPYLVAVYQLDADALQVGRYRNRQALELFAHCRATNTWPGRGSNLSLSLPHWHIDKHLEALK